MRSNVKKIFAFLIALSMVLTMSAVFVYAADEEVPVADAAPAASAEATAVPDETAAPEASELPDADVDTGVTDEAAEAISEVLGTTEKVTNLPDLDQEFASEYRFVNSLGVFEFLEDDFWKTEQVTRAQFATIIAKMIKAQTEGYPLYETSPFIDIDSSNFAYPAVCFLTDIGIINGDGNSTFRPNDAITSAEATKMIMCALGYKEAAENYAGGYPMGYISYAQIYNVYDGLNLGAGDTLDALTTGKLIKNALSAELLEGVVYTQGGVQYTFTGKTLLSETYNVTHEYGIVNGTYYSYINGDEITDEDEVDIAGTVYQVNEGIDPEQYLGYITDYYYMTDIDGATRDLIIYMEPRDGRNTSVTVSAQDIYKFNGNEITYADAKSNKEKRVVVTENTVVALNGQPYYTYAQEELNIKEGNMTIISHHSNLNEADVVIINEFYDGIVERVASTSKQVVFKNNSGASSTLKLPTLVLDEEDTSYRARLTMNGQDVKAEDLVKGDVITYTVSKDGKYIRGYVSKDEVYDMVSEIRTEKTAAGEVQKIKVGDGEYYVSKYCVANITAGSTLDFVLSFDGRIVGTKSTAANGGNYAFLIAASMEPDQFDEAQVKLKLFTKDGEVKIMNGANKIKSNIGGAIKNYKASEIAERAGAFANPTLVVYETNSAGLVKTLYVPADYTSSYNPYDELGFGKYYENKSARLKNRIIGTCAIDDTTVIFKVPLVDRDRESDYQVTNMNDLEDGTYNVQIYDIDRGIAGAMVITYSESTTVSDTADTLVVDELVETYNADTDEILTQIKGFSGGKEVNYTVDEDATMASSGGGVDVSWKTIYDLKKGDVIQYTLGSNGYISVYRVLFDCSYDWTYFFEFDKDSVPQEVLPNSDFYEIYGKVFDVYDFYIVVSSRIADEYYKNTVSGPSVKATVTDELNFKKAIPTTNANIYQYDVEKNEVTICDPYEIEPDSRVFIRTKDIDEVVDILVIKE